MSIVAGDFTFNYLHLKGKIKSASINPFPSERYLPPFILTKDLHDEELINHSAF